MKTNVSSLTDLMNERRFTDTEDKIRKTLTASVKQTFWRRVILVKIRFYHAASLSHEWGSSLFCFQDECYNYVKVLVPRNDETLFACGTNAFNPTCRNYKVNSPVLSRVGPGGSQYLQKYKAIRRAAEMLVHSFQTKYWELLQYKCLSLESVS